MNDLIPPSLAQTICEVHTDGAAWLARFPALLDAWQARWQFRVERPYANLSYNFVAQGTRHDGLPVVLKAGPPGWELQCEAATLRHYAAARGMVKLIAADLDDGALLLTRIAPGTPLLAEEDDVRATDIAARSMLAMRHAAPVSAPDFPTSHDPGFPTVGDWADGLNRIYTEFDGGTGPLPARLVDKAQGLFAELLADMEPSMLLHGDLHHENILWGTMQMPATGPTSHANLTRPDWWIIDPKGVWGEPAYEPGAWLRNPMHLSDRWQDPTAMLARRLDQFADLLDLPRVRLAAWGFAQAVLSAWWSVEDHPGAPGWQHAIAVAEWLEPEVRGF